MTRLVHIFLQRLKFNVIIVVRVCKEYINDIHFKNTFNLAEIIFAYEIHHSQNIKPIGQFHTKIKMQDQVKPTKLPNVFKKQTN